ncbi:ATP-binding protein [Rhodococcus koreensis]|uniref:ATP-binding protein n=1 Tax=Rhodococcus koreensis TaxID=99653 RepID=UPI0036D79DB0
MSVIDSLLAENAEAVLRESLSNVVRHAAADTVTVTVTVSVYDNLTIEVADNGVGIPDDAVIRRLDNLAARARQANGRFSIDTTAGGGTTIHWSAPLP